MFCSAERLWKPEKCTNLVSIGVHRPKFCLACHNAAVPKLFGLRTPFVVKYFSRTTLRPVQYYRYLGIRRQLLKWEKPQQWTFFHLSKIYSDGKNCNAVTAKSEHERFWKKKFNVLQTRACSHEIKSVRRCRNKVVCRCNMFFLVFKIICNPTCIPSYLAWC